MVQSTWAGTEEQQEEVEVGEGFVGEADVEMEDVDVEERKGS